MGPTPLPVFASSAAALRVYLEHISATQTCNFQSPLICPSFPGTSPSLSPSTWSWLAQDLPKSLQDSCSSLLINSKVKLQLKERKTPDLLIANSFHLRCFRSYRKKKMAHWNPPTKCMSPNIYYINHIHVTRVLLVYSSISWASLILLINFQTLLVGDFSILILRVLLTLTWEAEQRWSRLFHDLILCLGLEQGCHMPSYREWLRGKGILLIWSLLSLEPFSSYKCFRCSILMLRPHPQKCSINFFWLLNPAPRASQEGGLKSCFICAEE